METNLSFTVGAFRGPLLQPMSTPIKRFLLESPHVFTDIIYCNYFPLFPREAVYLKTEFKFGCKYYLCGVPSLKTLSPKVRLLVTELLAITK